MKRIAPKVATLLAIVGSAHACTGSDGPEELFPNGGGGPVAVDSSNVYWIDYGSGSVMKGPIGGGTPTTLATGLSPGAIAVDSTTVYWADNGALKKVSIEIGRAHV